MRPIKSKNKSHNFDKGIKLVLSVVICHKNRLKLKKDYSEKFFVSYSSSFLLFLTDCQSGCQSVRDIGLGIGKICDFLRQKTFLKFWNIVKNAI